MARPCKDKSCNGVMIEWHPTTDDRISGYWIEVDSGRRHMLCDFKDPRTREKIMSVVVPPVEHKQTSDILLEKITRMENLVQEIAMKIDDALPRMKRQ
jgi:hypothetical protein